MSEAEQFMSWCIQYLENIERLFKGNEKIAQEQRELSEYAIYQYLQEQREVRTSP